MKLSRVELEYLRASLASAPIVRPDSRHAGQMRPVVSEIDVLPMANGSARVRAPDGSDCLVGIKAKVVSSHTDLIAVSVDIAGMKDNEPLPNSLALELKQMLLACPELTADSLLINNKYAFRVSVDCVVFHYSSHPLVILSAAIFQALKSTRLPRSTEDTSLMDVDFSGGKSAEEAEVPQFDDDWSQSVPLCPSGWTPPLLLIVALVGSSVIVDPTISEQMIAEASLFITWKNSQVSAPIKTISSGSTPYCGAFDPSLLLDAYSLVEECAPALVQRLQDMQS